MDDSTSYSRRRIRAISRSWDASEGRRVGRNRLAAFLCFAAPFVFWAGWGAAAWVLRPSPSPSRALESGWLTPDVGVVPDPTDRPSPVQWRTEAVIRYDQSWNSAAVGTWAVTTADPGGVVLSAPRGELYWASPSPAQWRTEVVIRALDEVQAAAELARDGLSR